MSELIAITFDNRDEAQAARERFYQMSRAHLVELEDSVIAYKDGDRIRLDQTVNLTGAGALHGGTWGILLGFLFSIPAGPAAAPLLPLVSTAVGAGLGALVGKFSDFGIDDAMMKELAAEIDKGRATLFILVRKLTADKVLRHLGDVQGRVLTTSLPDDLESQLRRSLQHAAA